MYLFITEDGAIFSGETCSEAEMKASDDGIIQIVEISDPSKPLVYGEGMWVPVDNWC